MNSKSQEASCCLGDRRLNMSIRDQLSSLL
ncbi:hypothetical protein FOXYSP1_19119 [Fusarium oxysporum f. sp. phaseoli]